MCEILRKFPTLPRTSFTLKNLSQHYKIGKYQREMKDDRSRHLKCGLVIFLVELLRILKF